MHALLQQVIFYIFSAIALISALMVITQNNPVRCVLWLVLTFFASSVLWILMQSEFLALILVLVYVGAVMTLFLFVVMMLNIDVESKQHHVLRYLPFGLIIVSGLVGLMLVALPSATFITPVSTSNSGMSNTEALGMVLYTDYVWAFELAAVILLVAIIATITLVHRAPRFSKRQNIVKQIMTNSKDRLTLHAITSVSSEGEKA
jgi:NADH-quinone oxidoreductase subunit J